MQGLTVVLPYQGHPWFMQMLQNLLAFPAVLDIITVHPGGLKPPPGMFRSFEAPSISGGALWNRLIGEIRTRHLLLIQESHEIAWGPGALDRLLDVAETAKAGMAYADYFDLQAGQSREHSVNDYQLGSIRDDFNFGPVLLVSISAARSALEKYGAIPELSHAGLYDLRLKISTDHLLFHLQEYLYTNILPVKGSLPIHANGQEGGSRPAEEKHFDYVDSRYQAVQREMEAVATAHLQRLGAWLNPAFKEVPACILRSPVEVSVIIPVRDRRSTIADAVQSALSQETDFSFNVIVVDNHSTDGTTKILTELAQRFPTVKHLVPKRSDLGIGGCWNEAIYADCCGRYAVQLDSDDLYGGPRTLQKIVDVFRNEPYAAVIGAYTLVNEKLDIIPPGLIDHREWTADNGRNNALRINGLGAPRAYRTDLLRQIGFLNVSYGEDYAAVLRLSREYRLGRIYESLYLCRRWNDNTDAGLSVEKINRNDAFKDKIRTLEIMARRSLASWKT